MKRSSQVRAGILLTMCANVMAPSAELLPYLQYVCLSCMARHSVRHTLMPLVLLRSFMSRCALNADDPEMSSIAQYVFAAVYLLCWCYSKCVTDDDADTVWKDCKLRLNAVRESLLFGRWHVVFLR